MFVGTRRKALTGSAALIAAPALMLPRSERGARVHRQVRHQRACHAQFFTICGVNVLSQLVPISPMGPGLHLG